MYILLFECLYESTKVRKPSVTQLCTFAFDSVCLIIHYLYNLQGSKQSSLEYKATSLMYYFFISFHPAYQTVSHTE